MFINMTEKFAGYHWRGRYSPRRTLHRRYGMKFSDSRLRSRRNRIAREARESIGAKGMENALNDDASRFEGVSPLNPDSAGVTHVRALRVRTRVRTCFMHSSVILVRVDAPALIPLTRYVSRAIDLSNPSFPHFGRVYGGSMARGASNPHDYRTIASNARQREKG